MIVNVYSQPACAGCRQTKKRLFDLGIAYQEFDISTDDQAYDFVVNGLGVQEAPVVALFTEPDYTLPVEQWVAVLDRFWSGHRPDRIAELGALMKRASEGDDDVDTRPQLLKEDA